MHGRRSRNLEIAHLSEVKKIYHLAYEREYEYREDTELSIGYFLTPEEAKEAKEGLKDKPGFSEYPDGFLIEELRLGLAVDWRDGFFSEIGPPPKDAEAEYFDLPFALSKSRSR